MEPRRSTPRPIPAIASCHAFEPPRRMTSGRRWESAFLTRLISRRAYEGIGVRSRRLRTPFCLAVREPFQILIPEFPTAEVAIAPLHPIVLIVKDGGKVLTHKFCKIDNWHGFPFT